ncbi:uncharacterized protein [Rutidosis leptorrhynchoides]|uniref:uncharacterized protein isoform X3 n=1 Tax=Rutidosis leptorrhynchoides TaxID=125765 RepID=UPI003A98FB79
MSFGCLTSLLPRAHFVSLCWPMVCFLVEMGNRSEDGTMVVAGWGVAASRIESKLEKAFEDLRKLWVTSGPKVINVGPRIHVWACTSSLISCAKDKSKSDGCLEEKSREVLAGDSI